MLLNHPNPIVKFHTHQPPATRECPCGNHLDGWMDSNMNHTIWDMVLQIGVNEVCSIVTQTKPFLFAPSIVVGTHLLKQSPCGASHPKNMSLWYLLLKQSTRKFCSVPIIIYITPRKQSSKKNVVPVPAKFKTVCPSLPIAKQSTQK